MAWRGKGVGTRLAKHCIEQATARARTAASKGPRDVAADASLEYRIDVVPSAVAFWVRLGGSSFAYRPQLHGSYASILRPGLVS